MHIFKTASTETGVYQIYFIDKPDCKYIGSASSRYGMRARWKKHLADLIKDSHHAIHLQRTFNKKGLDDIKFEVIETCTPELCIEREQYWINHYKAFNKGFNICSIAGSCLGIKHSENVPRGRTRILCYHNNGEFYKEFASLCQAEATLKVSKTNISRVLNGKYKQVKGYMFRQWTKEYPLVIDRFSKSYIGTELEITNIITGEIKVYPSIRSVLRTGLSNTNILEKINTGQIIKKKKTRELFTIKTIDHGQTR